MSSRTKLNIVYVNVAWLSGAVLGAMTGSWLVFCLTTVGLLVAEIHSGDIRLGPGKSLRRR